MALRKSALEKAQLAASYTAIITFNCTVKSHNKTDWEAIGNINFVNLLY